MKVTKKEFISNYKKMRLCGVVSKPLEEVLPIINNHKATIQNTIPVSKMDIDTVNSIGKVVTIHKTNNNYYIVYTVIDYSLDQYVSWNTMYHECVVYVIL